MSTEKTHITKTTFYDDGSERVKISYPEEFGSDKEPAIYYHDETYLTVDEARDLIKLLTEALEFMEPIIKEHEASQ